MNFCFSFPAIRGKQAEKEFYSIMCPLDVLSKLFNFYNNEIPEELRAQRILNEKRIPEIRDYILLNPDSYVFSSITASIDGEYNFIESSEHNDIGILQISMNSNLLINDGQHRKAAIDEAIKEKPHLKDESISVVLFVDQGLRQSQQMFSDLNRHAVNVSNSLSILYNHRDPYAQIAKNILSENPRVFSLVEKGNSSIGKKSKKMFTLSNFHTAVKLQFNSIDLDHDTEFKNALSFAEAYWSYLFNNFNEWRHIIQGEVSAYSSRQVNISTYGIIIESIGQIGNELYHQNDGAWKNYLLKLNNIDWSRSNSIWLNRCVQSDGSIKKSTQTRRLTVNAIKKEIDLPLTEHELNDEINFRKEHDYDHRLHS